MSFYLAWGRGGAHGPVPPPLERSNRRRWRWAWLGVAWAAAGCTLTADSFEPIVADGAEADEMTVMSGLPAAAGGQRGNVPSSSPVVAGSGEGEVLPEREPVGANDGQLGGASEGTEAADVGLSDTDAEVVAPNGGAPDAGEVLVPNDDAPETDGASLPGESCPSGAFGASCYELFGELVSWDVAEQRCVDWGGHLASVGSPEEDGFLDDWPSALGIVDGDGSGLWLGGSDAALDGDFRWSDGSPLVFDNWMPSQPDNGVGVDCIDKRNDGTGGWYDRRCTDELRYVCERPL